MESSFNEFAKIITKHVLDDPQKLNELKERFEVLEHAQSKAGAAALGYLIGKAEKAEEDLDVYDQTMNIIRENRENEWICADAIFTLIYKWLAKEFEDVSMYASRGVLRKAFEDFIIL
jgi:hypothetical protein